MQIEGNLIIRWHEQGFDVRFVPAQAAEGHPTPILRLPDPAALEALLTRLDLPRDRIAEVLASPYVLHSLRLQVAAHAAGRAGLVPTPARRALDILTDVLRGSARLVSRFRPRS